jgi:hypothetical protein
VGESMKIYLNKPSMAKKEEIIALIDHQITWNCNFSGLEYELLPSEYDYNYADVSVANNECACVLLSKIRTLVRGM